MFCKHCGNQVMNEAVICPKCGCALKEAQEYCDKKWSTAMVLCLFLGPFGIHRFYTGQTASAIIQLFTGALFGIWWVLDMFMLSFGFYRVYGKRLQGYSVLFGLFALALGFIAVLLLKSLASA